MAITEKKLGSRSLPYGKRRPTKDERIIMKNEIIQFVKNNPGLSAMVGNISRELEFNVTTDIMHWMINDLKNEYTLIEVKGRFWIYNDLPKKMEAYL